MRRFLGRSCLSSRLAMRTKQSKLPTTPYTELASGVWTSSIRRAFKMADRIKSGTVWVNTYRAVSFLAPFGGYKHSGIGRESGKDAIDEYLQTKCVWINLAEGVPDPFVLR